jgi:choline dehydrogenase-like flavoprotein
VLIDARSLPQDERFHTDVCVVGAGAAGITLAKELAGHALRVLVIESGGLELDADTQALYRGRSVGLPYFPLDIIRLRYFGGTTNHWGGMCRPFTDEDFAHRDWIPYSGWPITKRALEPFLGRALKILHVRENAWSADQWAEPDKPVLPFATDRVVSRVHQRAWYQESRVRFGEIYRDVVTRAPNVTACLYGNAVRIDTDHAGRTVTGIHCASLEGNRFSVKAKFFVLATGGVENARLLLLSNHQYPAGLGNGHDMVGRFFTEHPQLLAGTIQPTSPRLRMGLYRSHAVRGSIVSASPELAEAVRRREGLVSVWLDFRTEYDERRVLAARRHQSLRYLFARLRGGEMPDDVGRHLGNVTADLGARAVKPPVAVASDGDVPTEPIRLLAVVDPAPNPNSRVTLGTDVDRLGQRRVTLDWRLSPIDKRSVRRAVEVLGMELGLAGLGRLQVSLDGSDSTWPDDVVGSGHHIGTTRMTDDPRQGVVDRDCRVHGISNLFIAGSSVFTTAGSGTPTLMIVTLALRLADHLKRLAP